MAETKVVNGVTMYKIGDTWGKVNRDAPNQAQTAQMQTQLQQNGTVDDRYKQQFGMAATPTYNYYTPPTNLGTNAQGKPNTEQDWLNSGGLNQAMGGVSGYSASKMSNGSYLDTTKLSSQQSFAAGLMDEVKAGKRTNESAMAALAGMGLDKFGNQALPSGYAYTPMAASNTASSKSGTPAVYYPGMNNTATNQPYTADSAGGFSLQSGGATPSLTASQQSAQDYITKAGKWGTVQDYASNNINRYNNGEINYDALLKDSQRVGYAIPPQASSGGGGGTGGIPTEMGTTTSGGGIPPALDNNYAIAAAEQARLLADRQRVAEQQISGLTSAYNRSNEILQGNRTLEDASINRTLNPFSGRTSYAKGLTGRERALSDETSQGQYNSAVQGVQQGLADYQNTAAQAIMARAAELENQAKQRAMQEAQLTGVYNGQSTMAAQQLALDQAQREWENRFNYGQATGTFSNGQQTLQKAAQEWNQNFQSAQFNWQKAQQTWENTFKTKSFEQDMKDAAASRGLQWASLNQRDKEFIADQAFREKQFSYQKEQDALNSRNKPGSNLTDKQSTDNLNIVMDDITSGATKEEARMLLQQNSAYLNDSDYKKLNDYINDNL